MDVCSLGNWSPFTVFVNAPKSFDHSVENVVYLPFQVFLHLPGNMECAVHTKTRSRDAGTCNSQDGETRLDPNSLCVYYVRRILPCSRIFPEDTVNVDVLHDT